MSEHIKKSHNKSLLLYHLVCPIKYRRKVLAQEVSATLKTVCLEISKRYEVHFLEIGCDDVSKEAIKHDKKYNCERNFSSSPRRKAIFVGREILDKRILCQYSWTSM